MNFEPKSYYNNNYEEVFKYYEYNGYIWYSFDTVTDVLGFSDNQKNRLWNKFIDDNDKHIFEEEKYSKIHEHRYINTVALFRLLSKFEYNVKQIRQCVENLEYELGYLKPFDENNHRLQINLGLLQEYINIEDKDKVYNAARTVCNSQAIQDLIHANPKKEELINDVRDEIYSYDDTEYVINKVEIDIEAMPVSLLMDDYEEEGGMTKRQDVPDMEKRKIMYKRNGENKTKSTCPSWLKDCLR